MIPGGSSGVTIRIDGDSSGGQAAVAQMQSAMGQLNQSAQQAGEGGFNAFQRFAVTLSSIIDIAQQVASAFDPVINAVQNMTEQMFQLNVQTEKNVYAWQYLFGGTQNAANLAQWTSQFSMNVPFTRQDLMGAVSTLGTKFDMQQVEQYMPILADLASTVGATAFGGQGVTLSQAAYALTDFMMGRSMPFKYEFHIDPRDLVKYGLDATVNSTGGVHINDLSTLFPALQRYDLAHGYAGAAQGTAQNTWWGEWSSFVDRLQNFGLQAGGTDLNGNVRKGSFFGELKSALDDISKWMDAHTDQIKQLADIISQDLAGAFKTAADWAGQFFQGLQQSGLLSFMGLTPQGGGPVLGGRRSSGVRGRGHDSGNPDYVDRLDIGADTNATPPLSGVGQFAQQLGTSLQIVLPVAKELAGIFFDFVLPAVHAVSDWIIANLVPVVGKLADFVKANVIPALKELATWFGEHVLPVAKQMADIFMTALVPALQSGWNTVKSQLLPALQQLWAAIEPTLIPAMQAIGTILTNVVGPAFNVVIHVVSFLVNAFAFGITAARDFWTLLGNFGTWLQNSLPNAFTALGNTVSGIFKGIVNGVIWLLNELLQAINSIHIQVPTINLPGGHSIGGQNIGFNIPDIPYMATGGRILSAGVAIVGEHGPELVHLPTGARVFPNGGSSSTRYGDSHVTNHLYNVPESTILRIVRGELASRGEMQSAMRRQPGSLAVAGSWGSGRGSY